jgi:hypothetical protein
MLSLCPAILPIVDGLWNITVDMASPYDQLPDEESDFSSMRDSFYILMNTNQYRMKWPICMTKEAEGLLRILLFSKDLRLVGSRKTLRQKRTKLARELRSNRRRGVVPVFISTLWFLFSLAISIQVGAYPPLLHRLLLSMSNSLQFAAFSYLGDNAEAHDLAIGLFLSWFPILILCSIIDRNPVASDDIRRKLNKLVDQVCASLQDDSNRGYFVRSFGELPESQTLACWVQKIGEKAELIKGDYFTDFAGQARTRFHYGAAHAILIDIEKSYIADHGRNWLANEREARIALVLGQVDKGLVWFDGRQFWQLFAAVTCVIGTGSGAFILSYFTPTVGLSCRSGGYLIFNIVSFALLMSELAVWSWTSPIRKGRVHNLVRRHTGVWEDHAGTVENVEANTEATMLDQSRFRKLFATLERTTICMSSYVVHAVNLGRNSSRIPSIEDGVRSHFQTLHAFTTRQWIECCFFQPLEASNTIWLLFIIMSQTTGAFVNCFCQTSFWAHGGGYLDFTQWKVSDSTQLANYWFQGTVISCMIMGVGMFYIVIEVHFILFGRDNWKDMFTDNGVLVVSSGSPFYRKLRKRNARPKESP